MLYSGALPMWTRKVVMYDAYASHVVVCKLVIWVMTSTATLSAWLLAALTAQRAASVVWTHRVNVICTRHKSVVIIVVITAVCGLLQSHTMYLGEVMKLANGTTDRCMLRYNSYHEGLILCVCVCVCMGVCVCVCV